MGNDDTDDVGRDAAKFHHRWEVYDVSMLDFPKRKERWVSECK